MNNNVVVLVASGDYLEYAKQVFSSLYFNAKWDEDVVLITNTTSNMAWFKKRGIKIFNKPLFKINKFISNPKIKLNDKHYLKYYLFHDYFKKWETVIYMDCDVIVRGDIEYLKNKKEFFAVRDYLMSFNPTVRNQFFKKNELFMELEKNYDLEGRGFNSGVMVFNPKSIDIRLLRDLVIFTSKYFPILRYYDQSAFNIFIRNFKELPWSYNYCSSRRYKNSLNPGVIQHYITIKPWNKNSSSYQEWKFNYDNANQINFSKYLKPKEAKFKFSVIKNYFITDKITKLMFLSEYFLNSKCASKTYSFFKKSLSITFYLGLFGGIIRKICPSTYARLKK